MMIAWSQITAVCGMFYTSVVTKCRIVQTYFLTDPCINADFVLIYVKAVTKGAG